MGSLSEASRPLSATEVVRAGLTVTCFLVCSVIFAKVAYAAVALFLHGTTYAVVSLF
jgi:hypothetical protein